MSAAACGTSVATSRGMTTAPWRSACYQVAGLDRHPVHRHRAAELLDPDPGVGWRGHPGQEVEAGDRVVEVADRAVGDHPERPETLVDRGVDLAPPGSVAGDRVEVLDHGDGRAGSGSDVLVVGQPDLGGFGCGPLRRLHGPDRAGAGVAHHRPQLGSGAEEGLDRVAVPASLRGHHLEGVAHRRGVEGPKGGQLVVGQRLLHPLESRPLASPRHRSERASARFVVRSPPGFLRESRARRLHYGDRHVHLAQGARAR